MIRIGSNIKALRGAMGVSQQALASSLRVTPQAVSKWELGINDPYIEYIPDIAKFFNITIDDLFNKKF